MLGAWHGKRNKDFHISLNLSVTDKFRWAGKTVLMKAIYLISSEGAECCALYDVVHTNACASTALLD